MGGQPGASGGAGGTPFTSECRQELANPACWSALGLLGKSGLPDLSGSSLRGAIFDGRYLVFSNMKLLEPNFQLRYDTQGALDDAASWSAFNTQPALGFGFWGGVSDGKYVYLSPIGPQNDANTPAVFARVDPRASFDQNSAWASFNLTEATKFTAAEGLVPGFRGAAFDGRFVYFAPGARRSGVSVMGSGLVLRYDPQVEFTNFSAWNSRTLTVTDARAKGFSGVVFDGRYTYFVPDSTQGLVVRFDTQAEFTTASAWTMFDVGPLVQYGSFYGGVFDGRYLYFVPAPSGSYTAQILRYDTQADFLSASAWSAFDTKALADSAGWSFTGSAFDGRFVYFVSNVTTLRYDTAGAFDIASSWQSQNLRSLFPKATGYDNASFDGRFVYFVPTSISMPLLRFEASPSGTR